MKPNAAICIFEKQKKNSPSCPKKRMRRRANSTSKRGFDKKAAWTSANYGEGHQRCKQTDISIDQVQLGDTIVV